MPPLQTSRGSTRILAFVFDPMCFRVGFTASSCCRLGTGVARVQHVNGPCGPGSPWICVRRELIGGGAHKTAEPRPARTPAGCLAPGVQRACIRARSLPLRGSEIREMNTAAPSTCPGSPISRTPLRLLVGALCAGALLASGCSTSIPRVAHLREGVSPVGGLSNSSEMVFAPQTTQAQLDELSADEMPEFSRADARLGSLPPGPLLATSQWPTPPQPSIERYRFISLPRSSSSIIIYLPQRDGFNPREFNSNPSRR